jgi:adenylate cyclase
MGDPTSTDARAESVDELIGRVARRLNRAGTVANVVGIFDTFLAVGFILPTVVGEPETFRLGWIDGPIVALLAIAVPLIGRKLDAGMLEPSRRWLAAGAPPGGGDVAAALRVPYRVAMRSGLMWAVAAAGFVILNLIVASPIAALVIGFTILSGAVTTSALFYLLAERAARPLAVRALAAEPLDEPIAPGIRDRLIAAWVLATGVPLLDIVVVGIIGSTKPGVNPAYVGEAAIFLAVVAIGAGLFALMFAASSIAAPVAAVRRAAERLEEGDLTARVRVDDASEVGLLEAGFNQMAAGLEEREVLRDLFGRHVGRDVAQAALGGGAKLGGEEREIAALFVDITGSTTLAMQLAPTEVVALLNRFFAIVVEVVEANGGLVNKFEGDAALSVFGAPVERPSPAGDALHAARELASRLRAEVPELDFGIGVSAGVAVAGNIGAVERFEYTVIGDPVNEAARLCELAKGRPERVVASERALDGSGSDEAARWRLDEAVMLRGRDAETRLALPVAAAAPTMVGSAEWQRP